ncbi:MAG: hypothetical protein WBX15_02135 [Thermoanaerobaculia bacterium]
MAFSPERRLSSYFGRKLEKNCKLILVFSLAILLSAAALLAGQSDNLKKAGSDPASKGVAFYIFHDVTAERVTADLLRPDKSVVATIAVVPETGHGWLVHYKSKQASFELRWAPSEGLVEVRDHDRKASKTFDTEGKRWVTSGDESLLVERDELLKLCFAVVADFEESGVKGVALVRDPWQQDDGGGSSDGTFCNGSEYRGFGAGTTRSQACYNATADANNQCWNYWCTGCCFFLDCDGYCSLGDYGCFAGRSGRACSGS